MNNLQSRTDRDGQTINYWYDFQNRLMRKVYPDNSQVNDTYDAAGRFKQVEDATGTYAFGYDNMSRLSSAATNYAFFSTGALTVQYGYDAGSNRTSMTDPQSVPRPTVTTL